jgi:hypothetical protein
VLVRVPCLSKRSVLLSIRIVCSLVLIGRRYGAHHAFRETYPLSHIMAGEFIFASAGGSVLNLIF